MWSLESQEAEDRAKSDKDLSPDQQQVDRHKQQIWLIVSSPSLPLHPRDQPKKQYTTGNTAFSHARVCFYVL